jgi:hypothetical protein
MTFLAIFGTCVSSVLVMRSYYSFSGETTRWYVERFDKTGNLVLEGVEHCSVCVTPLLKLSHDKLAQIIREDGDAICLNVRDQNPKLRYINDGKYEDPETGQKLAWNSRDLSCYQSGKGVETDSFVVPQSFNGEVSITENPDFIGMCFTGGYLYFRRIFIDGKLVEAEEYVVD